MQMDALERDVVNGRLGLGEPVGTADRACLPGSRQRRPPDEPRCRRGCGDRGMRSRSGSGLGARGSVRLARGWRGRAVRVHDRAVIDGMRGTLDCCRRTAAPAPAVGTSSPRLPSAARARPRSRRDRSPGCRAPPAAPSSGSPRSSSAPRIMSPEAPEKQSKYSVLPTIRASLLPVAEIPRVAEDDVVQHVMPISTPAAISRSVSRVSSALGSGSPDG